MKKLTIDVSMPKLEFDMPQSEKELREIETVVQQLMKEWAETPWKFPKPLERP